MEFVIHVIETIQKILWSIPTLLILMALGLYLTYKSKAVQFRYFFRLGELLRKENMAKKEGGDISSFESTMTIAASAVGTGSIVGVAIAISYGGFGAVFWLWVAALVSMAIKYSESVLAIKYRVHDATGYSGGPMYYIEQGLKKRWLGLFFAIVASFAAFGTGNIVQANSIASVLEVVYSVSPWKTALVLFFFTAIVLIGGVRSVARVSSFLVPVMGIFYVGGGLYILWQFSENLPRVFQDIISTAFTGQAASGAFLGSTVAMAMQLGMSRSFLCSEAGFGVPSIASAAAKTLSSVRQAIVSTMITLVATAVICTITACVIGVTGVFGAQNSAGSQMNGAPLIIYAFDQVASFGRYFVVIAMILFAYSTIIAWSYYGEKSIAYIFGPRSIAPYRILFAAMLIPGAVCSADIVWPFADILNAALLIPNLIVLFLLSRDVQKETEDFLIEDKKYSLVSE